MKNHNFLSSWNSLVPTLLEPGSSNLEPGRSKLGFYSTILLPAGSMMTMMILTMMIMMMMMITMMMMMMTMLMMMNSLIEFPL